MLRGAALYHVELRGHTQQGAVSVLECLQTQTAQTKHKETCVTAGRRVQKESSGFASLNPGPQQPHQILS